MLQFGRGSHNKVGIERQLESTCPSDQFHVMQLGGGVIIKLGQKDNWKVDVLQINFMLFQSVKSI